MAVFSSSTSNVLCMCFPSFWAKLCFVPFSQTTNSIILFSVITLRHQHNCLHLLADFGCGAKGAFGLKCLGVTGLLSYASLTMLRVACWNPVCLWGTTYSKRMDHNNWREVGVWLQIWILCWVPHYRDNTTVLGYTNTPRNSDYRTETMLGFGFFFSLLVKMWYLCIQKPGNSKRDRMEVI